MVVRMVGLRKVLEVTVIELVRLWLLWWVIATTTTTAAAAATTIRSVGHMVVVMMVNMVDVRGWEVRLVGERPAEGCVRRIGRQEVGVPRRGRAEGRGRCKRSEAALSDRVVFLPRPRPMMPMGVRRRMRLYKGMGMSQPMGIRPPITSSTSSSSAPTPIHDGRGRRMAATVSHRGTASTTH